MRGLRSFFWLVAAIALVLVSGNASALSYVMMRDAELFDQSEGVVKVTVAQRLPSKDGDRETVYLLSIDSVLAGPKLGERRYLALPGTVDAPSVNTFVNGVPALAVGAELLIFYSQRSDGALLPQQLTLGLFGKTTDGQRDVYVRHLERAGDHAKAVDRLRYHEPREAGAFEQWIRDRAHSIRREPDYLLDGTQVVRPKFVFSDFSSAGLQAFPGRWFQFDTDQSLQWTARPDGQSGAADSFQMLADALTGWTNDPTSRITMGYAGTAAAALACSVFSDGTFTAGCFSGHVLWNDPDGQISGSFTGVGILAFGGSSTSSALEFEFDGDPWYQRVLGFVVVQDGAGVGTVMNGNDGADGTELMTHEVGHAIGFGHSCEVGQGTCVADSVEDQATMRSAIHRDGRGATLGVDDIAGAAVIYPMPAPVAVGPTIAANTPGNGSSTALSGGALGAIVTGSITFSVSGGSGAGTTNLACTAGGAVTITSGATQNGIAVGGSVTPVQVSMTLTASSQQGTVACTATPQNGTVANFNYTFTAPAASAECSGDCVHRSGFEAGEGS